MIAAATIGLCFLTQTVAGWFGIELPDQANIDLVRQHAGWNMTFAFLCLQIVVLLPAAEEFYFRFFVFRRSQEPLTKANLLFVLVPTAIIFLIGVSLTCNQTIRVRTLQAAPAYLHPWAWYWAVVACLAAVEYVVRAFLCRPIAKLSPLAIALVSSVLFSAAHYLAQPWPDAAFVALFFFGLAQCWLYRKTDRLWCPILNHALFNLTNLILLFVIPQS